MSRVPAATNTLRILRHLASRRGPISAMSIATALELPRSSVYHLLSAMSEAGFVVHLEEERLYGIGPAASELSTAYLRQAPLARIANTALAALVDRLGETAHLSVLLGRDVVYVLEMRASGRPVLVTDVGVRLPAHLTASGRAILAGLSAVQIRALYPDKTAFADPPGESWSPIRLRSELQNVRRRGWAVESGDVTEGLSSVAVAVHDHLGWPTAAIALTFEDNRVGPDEHGRLAGELQAVADRLAAKLRTG
ncbi:IclR family transcriptional regulator [Mobilicoccus massiliensis]|uniref:IclR family transcriptional regulator n=1 Tax=Mobilicoccus massiliensis TaxID=1522310 RepID=UPI00058E6AFE|nr:IclR family transcriptional regulator [Mobilicoccus massiliensis]